MMVFSHYYNHGNGKTTLFNLDRCDNCGAEIQAANAVGGVTSDIPTYHALNIKEHPTLPEEGYYSDDLEGEACYNCNG